MHEEEDGTTALRVLDFGVAKLVEPDLTLIREKDEVIGTPRYMAPEQARAELGEVAPTTDIWAVGMIAVEMLTAMPYWDAPTPVAIATRIITTPVTPPSQRWPFLPRAFDAWFLKSCAMHPHDRFQTAPEQIEALAEVVSAAAAERLNRALPLTLLPSPAGGQFDRNDHVEKTARLDAWAQRPERAERSVAPVAYVPQVDPMPSVPPLERGGARVAAFASGAVALVLLGVLAGRAMFGPADVVPGVAAGPPAVERREARVEVEPLVVAASTRTAPFLELDVEREQHAADGRQGTQPTPLSPASRAPAKDCETPWYVDGEARRRYRPECMTNEPGEP